MCVSTLFLIRKLFSHWFILSMKKQNPFFHVFPMFGMLQHNLGIISEWLSNQRAAKHTEQYFVIGAAWQHYNYLYPFKLTVPVWTTVIKRWVWFSWQTARCCFDDLWQVTGCSPSWSDYVISQRWTKYWEIVHE